MEKQFAGFKGRIKKGVTGALLKLIDTIQSVSYDAQENLLQFFPALSRKKERCLVIKNGIEIERFIQAEPRNLRKELKLNEDYFLIGFMGRFMSQKGFKFLIEAVQLLTKKTNLVKTPLVLTFGEGDFIREDKQLIKDKGLEKYFRFMPFVPDIAGTIKGLDLVVMPSLWEACGLQSMEALVCGTPFVGTDCIGLREVLKGTPAIVVPKADAVSLANAIEKEMKQNSRQIFSDYIDTASRLFDVKLSAKELLDLYERMIHL